MRHHHRSPASTRSRRRHHHHDDGAALVDVDSAAIVPHGKTRGGLGPAHPPPSRALELPIERPTRLFLLMNRRLWDR